MDGEIPTPQNEQAGNKQGALKTFALLKVGIIELFFVAIVLALLFGTLNYFNILRLSEIFPNQLGFLPHQKQNKILPKPNSLPTPSLNYSPNVFQYDTEKAKAILTQYIKDALKPEFIPQALDIKQGLSIDNRLEDLKHQFGTYLTNSTETISVNFHYKESTNIPDDFSIFIQPSKVSSQTATEELANSLTSYYFTNPYSPITNCVIKGQTSYCENFKVETDGKRGYGIVFAYDQSVSPAKFAPIVFTCFIPKESKDYSRLNSCISP